MRIIALEVEKHKISVDDYRSLLKEEAKYIWKLYQDEIIREIYFRADKTTAVLILECNDLVEARKKLSKLPLVLENLIEFEFIPLTPYPGFSRLFERL